jgi:hypothetical protein
MSFTYDVDVEVRKLRSSPPPALIGRLLLQDTSTSVGEEVATYTGYGLHNSGTDPEVAVYNLDSLKYELYRPIVLSLRKEADNEYVASFPAAELSRSGDTAQEAVQWLKSSIVSLYEVLSRQRNQLGPRAARQLHTLGDYVVKKSASKT